VQVEFSVTDGVAQVRLNRPEAINALSLSMLHAIEDQLNEWFEAGSISEVRIEGAGERGYCSGADVRELAALAAKDANAAFRWLRDEYRLDQLVVNSPVNVSSVMHGVSMGGGLGLGLHISQRTATGQLRFAMPEVGIGLWPDVGVCFELSHAPGELGTYLAMTGASIETASAMYAGFIDEAPDEFDPEISALAKCRTWIDECFVGNDPVEIIARLENSDEPAANRAATLMRSRCPLSVCVALEAIRRAQTMSSVLDVLDQDLLLASNFVKFPDFLEGVRAQLVDKDRDPHWTHSGIENVTRAEVEAMFT
jgi:enoyl-CoA hydratase